jgi:hypothetical protein
MFSLPEFPSQVGNRGKLGEGDGAGFGFTIINEVVQLQTRYASGGQPRKYLVLQKVRFDTGATEIRSGYYMLSERADGTRYWTWARFSQLAPTDDFVLEAMLTMTK